MFYHFYRNFIINKIIKVHPQLVGSLKFYFRCSRDYVTLIASPLSFNPSATILGCSAEVVSVLSAIRLNSL